VIGAGVVGLAIARKLALTGRDDIVLERNAQNGEETSSRNSEVIHAGIHYPQGSLKAQLCVAGKRQLYAYCIEKGIAHARCGKLIVAVDAAQEPQLEAIARRALENGVGDLRWQNRNEIGHREPEIVAAAGLWSPSTGIVDSHGFMLALQGDLERAGGTVALRSTLTSGHGRPDGIALNILDPTGDNTTLVTRTVVNAAGLHAARVAAAIEVEPRRPLPALRYAKGSYFTYEGSRILI
jgi:L-2-hydroxyglutarate oxidase LhgO